MVQEKGDFFSKKTGIAAKTNSKLSDNISIEYVKSLRDLFPIIAAKVVVFYPPPFDKRVPDWARHFIAYVRGATGVRELKDLGYEE